MFHERRTVRHARCKNRTAVGIPIGCADPSDPDTWVEHSVQDVGDDVGDDDQEGNDEEEGAREELVLVQKRLEEVITDSKEREDLLEDDGATDGKRDADGEGCDDGQVGVPSHVMPSNDAFGETFRARGEHEILAHHFEHGRLHEEDRSRGADEDERKHWQERMSAQVDELEQHIARSTTRKVGEVLSRPDGVGPAPQRKPIQHEGEGPQENQPDPEGWHVVEEQAADDDGSFADSPPTPGDESADDDTEDVGEDRCGDEKEERLWQGVSDHSGHSTPFEEGRSEVEREHVSKELEHPNVDGIIDPERLSEL